MVLNFILYLLYGLAFFTLGVAILSRDVRQSELGIARIIWLLAFFGIVHGFHEWLELLEQLEPPIKTPFFTLFRLAVVSLSFLFLLYFGLFINIITFYGDQALKSTPRIAKAMIGVSALSLILVTTYFDLGSGQDINTRMFVAFPGGLLSGIGLIMYSRTVRLFSRNVAINFIFAGSCMICYAILTGVIPSDVIVPVLGIKVILFRGMSAFLIMFFTIRALSVFSLEQRELINERLLRFSQSEKLTSMGILAAGIAHEINNPLTNVSLNVEMLKDLVGEDEKINRKLEAIERNTVRASKIAKELLHFSREKETKLERTDINKVLASSCNLIRNQKLSSIIRLTVQNVPEIMGISWKLEEVFINLLMNSIDACSKEDSIEIETFSNNGKVLVTITDTGHGIIQDDIFKVFDPFYTTKEVGKGTGLGLSVCYNIIKQHGGEISLVSSENGGTIVTISFPVITDEN
ncbi:MAG: HAMP domain-containing histidine kinase [Deltaproteobacteria bacterium]|nr:HAMP domain-containing histidine kinase [Deltaproteobacteria bacterium]